MWPGVRPPSAAHAVRALHPFRLSVLRQRLLDDGGPVLVQHRVPTHEGEGEIRLRLNQRGPGFPSEVLAPTESPSPNWGGHISGPRIGQKGGEEGLLLPLRGLSLEAQKNPAEIQGD